MRSLSRSRRDSWLRCPTPSGTIMPPYAEIRAARVTLHENTVASVWRLASETTRGSIQSLI